MRRVGQARRRDVNEAEIIRALKACGADVYSLSGKGCPDLLIRFRGTLYAFEVKSRTGTRTAAQEDSQWMVIRSVDDALRAIGVAA